jgi:hypothetical protein
MQLPDSSGLKDSIQRNFSVGIEDSVKLEATSLECDSSSMILSSIFLESSPGCQTITTEDSSPHNSSLYFTESTQLTDNREIAASIQPKLSVNIENTVKFETTKFQSDSSSLVLSSAFSASSLPYETVTLHESFTRVSSIHFTQSTQLSDSSEGRASISGKVLSDIKDNAKLEATTLPTDSSSIIFSAIFPESSPGHQTIAVEESSPQDSSLHFTESTQLTGSIQIAESRHPSSSENLQKSRVFEVTNPPLDCSALTLSSILRVSSCPYQTAIQDESSTLNSSINLTNSGKFDATTCLPVPPEPSSFSIIEDSRKLESMAFHSDSSSLILSSQSPSVKAPEPDLNCMKPIRATQQYLKLLSQTLIQVLRYHIGASEREFLEEGCERCRGAHHWAS